MPSITERPEAFSRTTGGKTSGLETGPLRFSFDGQESVLVFAGIVFWNNCSDGTVQVFRR
jgi:hypothetical protein